MGYVEPQNNLSEFEQDLNRAIDSLREEWDAINLYQQRASQTKDEELKEILRHNRDEEIEHAAMLTEWIRRRVPEADKMLKEILFKEGKIEGEH